jgi:hypothetical protein
MYKILFAILMSLEMSPNVGQHYINPTGTYTLVSKAKVVKGETYGYTGDIQVKALSKNKIVVVLGVDMGAPAYNSGELFDTLKYVNNTCVHNGDKYDPTCRITLKFSEHGINVTQKQADLNSGCGFGHGVFADGHYEKNSEKVPVLRHPQTGELIK